MSTHDNAPHLIDALPYIETIIDDDDHIRDLAMKEIDDELEIFPPERDYLEHLPPIDKRPFYTPLIRNEQLGIERQSPVESSTALAHIQTDKPPTTDPNINGDDLDRWNSCLNQIKVKLEYQQRQLLNLDILKSYNSEAWKLFREQNDHIDGSLKKELDYLNKTTQQVNWSRKEAQEQVGKTLDILRNEWNSLVDKNRILREEIKRLSFKNQVVDS